MGCNDVISQSGLHAAVQPANAQWSFDASVLSFGALFFNALHVTTV
jgi:hypothetical protein